MTDETIEIARALVNVAKVYVASAQRSIKALEEAQQLLVELNEKLEQLTKEYGNKK